MKNNRLSQGQKVKFDSSPFKGTGIIIGAETFDIGLMYIIQPDKSIATKDYPYSHLICSFSDVKVIKEKLELEDRKDSPHHHTNRLD